jgi:hypothetical protein
MVRSHAVERIETRLRPVAYLDAALPEHVKEVQAERKVKLFEE